MMADAHDVVIVGGGVIGLSIAFALAREGIRPTVLDRRDLGREASWAGAGLIPPVAENRSRQPLVALRSWSAELYPRLVGRARGRDRHRHRLSPHRRRRRRLDRSRRPGAASHGRPLAGRRNRLRATGPWRLRAGRAGIEPGAQGRLLLARPSPGPQSPAPAGIDGRGIASAAGA